MQQLRDPGYDLPVAAAGPAGAVAGAAAAVAAGVQEADVVHTCLCTCLEGTKGLAVLGRGNGSLCAYACRVCVYICVCRVCVGVGVNLHCKQPQNPQDKATTPGIVIQFNWCDQAKTVHTAARTMLLQQKSLWLE
eukprot:1152052-Pelagomonas_calceolata.AAC.5